ncbi:beta-ketoacyl-ACP synthase III [Clostridium sp.]|uniref:beta-ketoacyl-ACP synthase III n=1 Tax=Clostridium sp. TaxID=1506 RepID=UPI003464D967
MSYVEILGSGAYVPSKILSNKDLEDIVDTSDEWIVTRTGIRERRIAVDEETSDVASKAAERALKDSKVSKEEIDYIIVATLSGENVTPSTACMVQSKIGAVNATAYDLNGACSGFIYALIQGEALIKASKAKKVLVIGVELLSKFVDWKDRNTCVLFGDGAGAVVLSEGDKGIITTYSKSFGDLGMCLTIGGTPLNNIFMSEPIETLNSSIHMDGGAVFKFATSAMIEAVEKVVIEGGLTLEDVDVIIPHQANYRIIEYASKKLKMNINKFFINLDKYGNTSSASVPIALNEALEKGIVKPNMNVVMVAFGGGLTVGATLVKF